MQKIENDLLLHERIVKIAEDYFGPVAPRFVERLIKSHLNKRPEQLTCADMPEFIKWMRVTVAMLTDDKATIDEIIKRLKALED